MKYYLYDKKCLLNFEIKKNNSLINVTLLFKGAVNFPIESFLSSLNFFFVRLKAVKYGTDKSAPLFTQNGIRYRLVRCGGYTPLLKPFCSVRTLHVLTAISQYALEKSILVQSKKTLIF